MGEFLVGDRVKWSLTDTVYKVLFIKGDYILIESELTGNITNVNPESIVQVPKYEEINVIKAITKAYADEPVFYSFSEDGLKLPFDKFTSFDDIEIGVEDLYDLESEIIFYIESAKSTGGK